MAALFAVSIAIIEWVKWFTKSPPNPILLTIIAMLVAAFAAYRLSSIRPLIWNLKQGRDGEKAVGQFLERLRNQGAHVLHDFPGDGFNIDHIVIHTSGIYLMETKTFTKPATGEAVITYDGETLLVAGHKPDRDPVRQAKASARWLAEIIAESTGKNWNVTPVLLFPGWLIDPHPGQKQFEVHALNPKVLPNFIGNSRTKLTPEEVSMASSHLSRYARSVL